MWEYLRCGWFCNDTAIDRLFALARGRVGKYSWRYYHQTCEEKVPVVGCEDNSSGEAMTNERDERSVDKMMKDEIGTMIPGTSILERGLVYPSMSLYYDVT